MFMYVHVNKHKGVRIYIYIYVHIYVCVYININIDININIYIYIYSLFACRCWKALKLAKGVGLSPLVLKAVPPLPSHSFSFCCCEELCGQELASPTVSKVYHVRHSVLVPKPLRLACRTIRGALAPSYLSRNTLNPKPLNPKPYSLGENSGGTQLRSYALVAPFLCRKHRKGELQPQGRANGRTLTTSMLFVIVDAGMGKKVQLSVRLVQQSFAGPKYICFKNVWDSLAGVSMLSLVPPFVEACLTSLLLGPLGPPSQVEVKQSSPNVDPMLILDLMCAHTARACTCFNSGSAAGTPGSIVDASKIRKAGTYSSVVFNEIPMSVRA